MSATVHLDPLRHRMPTSGIDLLAAVLGINGESPEVDRLRQLLIVAAESIDRGRPDASLTMADVLIYLRGQDQTVDDRAETAMPMRTPAEALVPGRFESRLSRRLYFLNQVNEALANEFKTMSVLDCQEVWGTNGLEVWSSNASTTVDIELARFAALLDVLQELSPQLQNTDLGGALKSAVEAAALQAMAERDVDHGPNQ